MPQQFNANKPSSQKGARYDDWMCLLCQNHNYSFRLICNRCHVQTKEQNTYMTHIYQRHLELAQEHQQQLAQLPQHPYFALDSFPNVLLLMINDDPWEEHPQRREPSEILNVKWINNLIEEVFVRFNLFKTFRTRSNLSPLYRSPKIHNFGFIPTPPIKSYNCKGNFFENYKSHFEPLSSQSLIAIKTHTQTIFPLGQEMMI